MQRHVVPAVDHKTTSLNLLGIERGRIAQVSLNAITRLPARAFTREMERHGKTHHASTSREQLEKEKNLTKKTCSEHWKGKGQGKSNSCYHGNYSKQPIKQNKT